MTPLEIQQEFYKELKQLLAKYEAELTLEDFSKNYNNDYKIVVDFSYRENLFDEHGTGCIPQLIIGGFLDGL